jgi:hypothetical protein
MLRKRIIFLCTLSLISFSCYANKIDLLLMGGPSFSHISNDSHVNINQFMVNKYETDSRSQVEPVVGVGVAHIFDCLFKMPLSISIGLSGYYNDFSKIQGTEFPFINDGIYDSLNYQFHAESLAAMVESRLTYTSFDWQPYAIVGVGASWNRLYDYSETPTNPSESAASSPYPFPGHTNTGFAYELGVGMQKKIYLDLKYNMQYFLTLDYRYMNFGKGELGSSFAQTSNDRLHVSNLDTQALMLALKITL